MSDERLAEVRKLNAFWMLTGKHAVELLAEVERLRGELSNCQLADIRISNLMQHNKQCQERIEQLEAENAKLREQLEQKSFIIGRPQ